MPEVVSDTSPLQYLHQASLLHLLPVLYGHILVPEAVAAELERGISLGFFLPVVQTLESLGFFLAPTTRASVLRLASEGPGPSA